jgi:mitochondrial fission protein ELM1
MNCWVVTEGMIGMENQCLGVAEALGETPAIKRIGLRQPWKFLCPFIGFEQGWSFTGDPLRSPWPDLAIGCGRKSIAALRYIKRASGGKTFITFIQDPKIPTCVFDLVAVPAHDARKGDNIIETVAAPGRLNRARLEEGRAVWADVFGTMPSPRVVVLIGGSSQSNTLTPENVERIAAQLNALAAEGYHLIVTPSRRTGDENTRVLRKALEGSGAWIWDGTGDNPYFGMLGWADYVIVTSDSVSMISEATVTGKPVYITMIDGHSGRHDRFYDSMASRGITRMFEGGLEAYTYVPPDDTKLIADEIRRRMGLHAI